MRFLETLWPPQFLSLPDLKTGWPGSTRPMEILILKARICLLRTIGGMLLLKGSGLEVKNSTQNSDVRLEVYAP